jgi:hypothetical protein
VLFFRLAAVSRLLGDWRWGASGLQWAWGFPHSAGTTPINSAIRGRHTATEGCVLYSLIAASPIMLFSEGWLAGEPQAACQSLGLSPVGKPIYSGEKFSKSAVSSRPNHRDEIACSAC